MATVQISDVIVPVEFSGYIAQNTAERTALMMAGVMVKNPLMLDQLQAGAFSFTVPFWLDLANDEANISTDDPLVLATSRKLASGRQLIRKSELNQSWSAMNLASELSGSDALARIRDRAVAYWDRQLQRRLVATIKGVMADNVANSSSDMVSDISAAAGAAAKFSAAAVIDAAGTLGDGMENLVAIGMHSDVYRAALKNDLVTVLPQSTGGLIKTFRGLQIVIDDGLPAASGTYTTVLFGPGAVGFAVSAPRIAPGTEIYSLPAAGNGGGVQTLHSRLNICVHPLGFTWKDITVSGMSPSLAELALAANWGRVVERKAVPLAFLVSKI